MHEVRRLGSEDDLVHRESRHGVHTRRAARSRSLEPTETAAQKAWQGEAKSQGLEKVDLVWDGGIIGSDSDDLPELPPAKVPKEAEEAASSTSTAPGRGRGRGTARCGRGRGAKPKEAIADQPDADAPDGELPTFALDCELPASKRKTKIGHPKITGEMNAQRERINLRACTKTSPILNEEWHNYVRCIKRYQDRAMEEMKKANTLEGREAAAHAYKELSIFDNAGLTPRLRWQEYPIRPPLIGNTSSSHLCVKPGEMHQLLRKGLNQATMTKFLQQWSTHVSFANATPKVRGVAQHHVGH